MSAKRQKQQNYITIPHQGLKPEWVEGVSTEELLAAHGTNVGALGSAEVSYSLENMLDELQGSDSFEKPRVLVVSKNLTTGKTVLRSVLDAGFDPMIACTKDLESQTQQRGVVIGERFSEKLFDNSYAITQAAQNCGAKAVLLVDSSLSHYQGFLGLEAAYGIKVFRSLSTVAPQSAWVLCRATKSVQKDISWKKCAHCELLFDVPGLTSNHFVCPSCGQYYRMNARQRIDDMFDQGSFSEWDSLMPQANPLDFPGYPEKIQAAQEKTALNDAVVCGEASITGIRFAVCIMDSQFFMGSMGTVVGEKITRAVERATAMHLPLIIFTASGGARMQEGLMSLMQMAKVSCALSLHSEAGLLYISVITDPTTGGVTASFAMQGDIILAEPKALIGFAGQRVIQDTIKQSLPEGFQTAEFALEHGLIDAIVERHKLRETLAHLLAVHMATNSEFVLEDGSSISYATVCENLQDVSGTYRTAAYSAFPQIKRAFLAVSQKMKPVVPKPRQIKRKSGFLQNRKQKESQKRLDQLLRGGFDAEAGTSLDEAHGVDSEAYVSQAATNYAWESVQLARNTHRPTAKFYIESFVDGFIELHGDRAFGDDGAIMCGLGWIGTQPVTIIAQEKGSDLKERLARNFGCPQPEGYRKSLRIMKQAEKFGRPIVCLVDTQGAYCGMDAEERGQGNAIADNLINMASLRVPVVSVLLGEGGSGGALALAVADKVAMQRHAVYSILSPEGFASILWKDKSRAPEAAAVMKMSAQEACDMGIVDAVLSEGDNPAHLNPDVAAACVRSYIVRSLKELLDYSEEQLLEARYERFRKF